MLYADLAILSDCELLYRYWYLNQMIWELFVDQVWKSWEDGRDLKSQRG